MSGVFGCSPSSHGPFAGLFHRAGVPRENARRYRRRVPTEETSEDSTPKPAARTLDAFTTMMLWLAHAVLALITVAAAALTAFVTDACVYHRCGNPVWTEVAVGTAIVSAVASIAVSVTLVVRRVRRGLPSWPPAAWCCAIQLAMILMVVEIGRQAGTLD